MNAGFSGTTVVPWLRTRSRNVASGDNWRGCPVPGPPGARVPPLPGVPPFPPLSPRLFPSFRPGSRSRCSGIIVVGVIVVGVIVVGVIVIGVGVVGVGVVGVGVVGVGVVGVGVVGVGVIGVGVVGVIVIGIVIGVIGGSRDWCSPGLLGFVMSGLVLSGGAVFGDDAHPHPTPQLVRVDAPGNRRCDPRLRV